MDCRFFDNKEDNKKSINAAIENVCSNQSVTAANFLIEYFINTTVDQQSLLKLMDILNKQAQLDTGGMAAYVLSRLYAGILLQPENILYPILSMDRLDREKAAILYAKRAIVLQCDIARQFLFSAFLDGLQTCITIDNKAAIELYAPLIVNNDQAALYELGCYHLGYHIDGSLLNLENDLLKNFPQNHSTGVNYLFSAIEGDNVTLAGKAFERLFAYFSSKEMNAANRNENVFHIFWNYFKNKQTPLLAVYFAFIYSPDDAAELLTQDLSAFFAPVSSLNNIVKVDRSFDTSKQFLQLALKHGNKKFKDLAEILLERLEKFKLQETNGSKFRCYHF